MLFAQDQDMIQAVALAIRSVLRRCIAENRGQAIGVWRKPFTGAARAAPVQSAAREAASLMSPPCTYSCSCSRLCPGVLKSYFCLSLRIF